MTINLPDKAKFIIDTLETNGYECFAVGGCVRDSLSQREVNDWDFTTNATPNEIESCFSDYTTIDIGRRFGTICVVVDSQHFEITTYRTDGEYADSRHPDIVSFSTDIYDDLSRRDFTVNAMAYNDRVGLIDKFDGLTDLKFGVIRCVGDPDVRFSEDALRIFRALRFASVLGYSIESNTSRAILKNKDLLIRVAHERYIKELTKLLCGDNADFILRRYKDVIAVVIPEVSAMFNFEQKSIHHNKDVWRHTVSAVKNCRKDPLLRMVMLLHDIGKPMTASTDSQGNNHFYNHQKLSAAMASTILKRLKFPNDYISTVCKLIEYHDYPFEKTSLSLKRIMRELGADNVKLLFEVRRADVLAQSSYMRTEKLDVLDFVEREYDRIISSSECYSLDTLCINGRDILHMGPVSGQTIGLVLSKCLDKVIKGELENERQPLLLFAQHMIKSIEGMS